MQELFNAPAAESPAIIAELLKIAHTPSNGNPEEDSSELPYHSNLASVTFPCVSLPALRCFVTPEDYAF